MNDITVENLKKIGFKTQRLRNPEFDYYTFKLNDSYFIAVDRRLDFNLECGADIAEKVYFSSIAEIEKFISHFKK